MSLPGLLALIALQLAGEAVVRAFSLAIPGPVLGLAALAALALFRGGLPPAVESCGDALLKHLALLFVPAGVGLVQFGPLIAAQGIKLILVLVISTAVTLVVTAFVFAALARRNTSGSRS